MVEMHCDFSAVFSWAVVLGSTTLPLIVVVHARGAVLSHGILLVDLLLLTYSALLGFATASALFNDDGFAN